MDHWAVEANAGGAPPPAWIAGLPRSVAGCPEKWTEHVGQPGAIGELIQIVSGPISATSIAPSSPPEMGCSIWC